MGRKEQMKEVAQKHTETMDKLYSEQIKISVSNTHIYGIKFNRENVDGKKAEFSLEQSYTQDSVIRNAEKGKVAVLNFASYRHPGGGFINGAMAQEEAICHDSFLYNVIREFDEYYEWNEANYNMGLYKNRALYSPDVYFFSKDGCNFVTADVITCAAPNRSVIFKAKRFTEDENEKALKDRIRFIRDICDTEKVDTLISGAFGCGVFAQKPEMVARYFVELFKDTTVKNVIFAVPPDRNYDAFQKELSGML